MEANYHITITRAAEIIKNKDVVLATLIEDGSMSVEYYAPAITDKQTSHTKDELYIIATGSSEFLRDKEQLICGKGDVIFVPALMPHRFINFSDDFATWVVFYGDEKIKK